MSCDTTKENATNADSSSTQKLNSGNLEAPEKSDCRADGDRYPHRTKEEGRKKFMDSSNLIIEEKTPSMRYFIIKSLNHDNLQLSVEKGIWATQVMNEPILEEAFHSSCKVILIFSVNSSGSFQGYAQMMSSVGRRRDSVWSQGTGSNNPWGRSFRVKWLRLSNLPFHKTLHLKNPLNEFKPVKISRDCQELSSEIGEALCELIDGESEGDLNMKRDIYHVGRPGLESGCSFPDKSYGPDIDMTWATSPMLSPSFFYQYHAGASRSHLVQHGSVGVITPERLPVKASKGAPVRHPDREVNNVESPVDAKVSSQGDSRWMTGQMSPLSTLSEDEFLEMSYEEYLEAHSRGIKQLYQPAGGQSRRKEDSSSKEHDDDDDDDDMRSHGDHVSSNKRSRH